MSGDIKVKSLAKALRILNCFSIESPELGISEISRNMGLYKSNVYNIVDTFVRLGFLERNSHNDKYRLGLKILELGHVVSGSFSFRQLILPDMQQLAEQTGETMYLAVPGDLEVIYLDSCSPRQQLSVRSISGVKAPLYCTGIGKSMLAWMPEQIQSVIDSGLSPFTEHTITEPGRLLEALRECRVQGYAVDRSEHEYAIHCVGTPICGRSGEVMAGISISGPSPRFGEETIQKYGEMLKEMVLKLQRKL